MIARTRRVLILTLTLIVLHLGAMVVPEPCPVTYALWMRSFRWGSMGTTLRLSSFMRDGLDACDSRPAR